ncbi:hypothetical protein FB451DRAFT_1557407 [Mycena latifolia]|nr:hypothetical protein FB451DRAFT_1557407 [Mycena latifolia]
MPHQIDDILGTNKIHFVVGDTTERDFGIDSVVLGEMADSTVYDNYLPTLELAQLASRFKNLGGFVYISTACANSFLPDGIVEERIYAGSYPEQQLSEILETGSAVQSLPKFIWPYVFAKHLTERLLLSRSPQLPLFIRPGSSPVATFLRAYMAASDTGVVHVSPRHPAGANVPDEIVVANLILLHAMHATTGVVHARAQCYVPIVEGGQACTPNPCVQVVHGWSEGPEKAGQLQARQQPKPAFGLPGFWVSPPPLPPPLPVLLVSSAVVDWAWVLSLSDMVIVVTRFMGTPPAGCTTSMQHAVQTYFRSYGS